MTLEKEVGMWDNSAKTGRWPSQWKGAYAINPGTGKRMNMTFDLMEFEKTGSEIVTSINGKLEKQAKEVEEIQKNVAPILKSREVTMEDAVEAARDNTGYSNVLGKMSGTRTPEEVANIPVNVITVLQKDLNKLRDAGRKIDALLEAKKDLERVKRNVVPTAKYVLGFFDLDQLGF